MIEDIDLILYLFRYKATNLLSTSFLYYTKLQGIIKGYVGCNTA